MLCELRIENFAIIDHLELKFKPGLIAFTGETGAGKSIIMDAIEMLVGGRADTTMIRSGAERAHVEATFQIPEDVRSQVHAILEREDLLDDKVFLTLGREIRSNGRSVDRVNGRVGNVGLLRELGEHLVDLHGQSEHLSLLRVREHLDLLDRYAGTTELLNEYARIYHQLESVRRSLNELRRIESESARRMDLLKYQINEIESARLRIGEEETLRAERNRVANAETIATSVQTAVLTLDEGTPESPSVMDLLGQVGDALHDLARVDPSQSEKAEQWTNIFESLSELTKDLRAYLESVEFNPKRLDWVEERLNLIHNLKRKYGGSIEAVLAFAAEARKELDSISHAGEKIAELQSEEEALLAQIARIGQALSAKRRKAAERLSQEIEIELADLNMPQARFMVDIRWMPNEQGVLLEDGQRVAFDATGLDKVEFLIAPNPGEGFKPLVKIASGGETSRSMLALKNVLARADRIPVLIFDEIDQGIGGRVGASVGQKLWRLGRFHQVLCVTHLPQLAAYGDQHLQVQKDIQQGRTVTLVKDLYGEEREKELATMLGELSESTLQSVREMLLSVSQLTEQVRS